MESKRLEAELDRVIRGELDSSDIQRLAESEGFRSFSELCESVLPESLERIRLDERTVTRRLRAYLAGELDLFELWFWADELYHISYNHEVSFGPRTEELVIGALSAVSIVANDRIFTRLDRTRAYLDYIARALDRRRSPRVRDIFATIFEDLPVMHLACKGASPDIGTLTTDEDEADPGAGGELPGWADVVVLDRPYVEGLDLYLDYNWLVAFTVRVAGESDGSGEASSTPVADGELPPWIDPSGWADATSASDDGAAGTKRATTRRRKRRGTRRRPDGVPFADRIAENQLARCIERAPNFDRSRYRPVYQLDAEGLGEIVLDADGIGEAELVYAAKLFCLANRVPVCWLDGRRVKTIVAD